MPILTGGKIIEGADPVGDVTATGDVGTYRTERVNASGGAVTRTLPAAAASKGLRFEFIKTDSSANAVTIDGNGSETINGAASVELSAQYEKVAVRCNGTGWEICG